jgi:hypothetical protein
MRHCFIRPALLALVLVCGGTPSPPAQPAPLRLDDVTDHSHMQYLYPASFPSPPLPPLCKIGHKMEHNWMMRPWTDADRAALADAMQWMLEKASRQTST